MGTQRTILEPCAPKKTFGSVTHRTDRDSYRASPSEFQHPDEPFLFASAWLLLLFLWSAILVH